MTAHGRHVPEPPGMFVQPFGPDPGTEPLCSNWNTNRISPSAWSGLAASTCVVFKKITNSPSKITPSINCFFIIIYFSCLYVIKVKKKEIIFFPVCHVKVVVCLLLVVCGIFDSIMTYIYRVSDYGFGLIVKLVSFVWFWSYLDILVAWLLLGKTWFSTFEPKL